MLHHTRVSPSQFAPQRSSRPFLHSHGSGASGVAGGCEGAGGAAVTVPSTWHSPATGWTAFTKASHGGVAPKPDHLHEHCGAGGGDGDAEGGGEGDAEGGGGVGDAEGGGGDGDAEGGGGDGEVDGGGGEGGVDGAGGDGGDAGYGMRSPPPHAQQASFAVIPPQNWNDSALHGAEPFTGQLSG